ncbi:PRPF3 [Mytilus coruscus]|uniref:PRPF3 n=1 Tax=Mytilus coruscus TaxID=42192 RepID=A0A6J8ENJ9_MYTCO|nr:PRPF3 [Mytilus coruscus]
MSLSRREWDEMKAQLEGTVNKFLGFSEPSLVTAALNCIDKGYERDKAIQTVTPNISIALYRYLCQHIVGSEDYVKQIRLMTPVGDNTSSNKEETIITSGSFGEGLHMRGSDLDVMFVSRTLEVYENIKPFFNPNITYFSMERDDVKPGYAQLKLDYYGFRRGVFKLCEEQNGNLYFSSTLPKQKKVSKYHDGSTTIHGPCISDSTGDLDLAFCLQCNMWVSSAVQWIIEMHFRKTLSADDFIGYPLPVTKTANISEKEFGVFAEKNRLSMMYNLTLIPDELRMNQ